MRAGEAPKSGEGAWENTGASSEVHQRPFVALPQARTGAGRGQRRGGIGQRNATAKQKVPVACS